MQCTGWRRAARAWWCEEWRHGASKARGWQSRSEAATAGTGRDGDAPNPADAPVHRILRKKMLQFGGWVRGVPALVPLILVALAAASSDLFDNQLGDINYCKKQCQMSIKNKSPAKVSATYQMLLQYIVTACGKKNAFNRILRLPLVQQSRSHLQMWINKVVLQLKISIGNVRGSFWHKTVLRKDTAQRWEHYLAAPRANS